MKKLLTLISFLISLSCFSQNIKYNSSGRLISNTTNPAFVDSINGVRGLSDSLAAYLNLIRLKADSGLVKINPQGGYTVLPLHYGILRGRGGIIGESYSTQTYTVASSSSAGSTTITLTANSSDHSQALIVGQLIVYLGTDGEYYTASIRSISGAVITLNSALEVGVGTGQNVFNAYVNDYHLTLSGFNAYADYLIRKNATRFNVETRTAFNSTSGSPVVTLDTSNTFDNPGSKGVTSWVVTSPTTNDYIKATFTVYKTGAYKVPIAINTYGNDVSIVAFVNGFSSPITVNCNDVTVFDLPVWISNSNSTVTILAKAVTSGQSFEIKQNALVLKEDGLAPKLNSHVRIVMMGDSWFAFTGIAERLRARLPNAEIINLGVGGRTANALIGVFDTEVAPLKPDIIICNISTNDYANLNYSTTLFGFYINQLKTKSSLLGAHLILATPTVAPQDAVSGAFNLSRSYADSVTYFNEILPVPNYISSLQEATSKGSTTTTGITTGSTGTSNTPNSFSTNGQTGIPAITAFKNSNRLAAEPIQVFMGYNSGLDTVARIKTSGDIVNIGSTTSSSFITPGKTSNDITLGNGTWLSASTLPTTAGTITNNTTTTPEAKSILVSGNIGISNGTGKFFVGTTAALTPTKSAIVDAGNSFSILVGGASATPNWVALGTSATYGAIQGYTNALATRDLLFQPLGASIAIGKNAAPDASSIMDIVNTAKGVLIPRMTAANKNAISSPATGLLIYQTDSTGGFYVRTSTGLWKRLVEERVTAPTVTLGSNITGSVALSAGSTDSKGTVTVTVTGISTLATLNELFTLTFSSAFASAPTVVYSNASSQSAALEFGATGLYVKNAGTTSFQIATNGSYTTPASATYSFNYQIQ